MEYYTSTISVPLAEKLKEKGMPMSLWEGVGKYMEQLEDTVETRDGVYLGIFKNTILYQLPTYAEVFDWLLSEKIYVRIIPFGASRIGEETWDWTFYIDQLGEPYTETDFYWHTWHEAAEKAIEKALTLI